MKNCENYQNLTQRHEVNKCCQKNVTDRLAVCRIATNFQFVKPNKKSSICKAQ